MRLSKVKICGLRRLEDVAAVNKYKPDYIGFVFAESKRQISLEEGKLLAQKLNDDIIKVGVFVNQSEDYIADLVHNHVIDMVQLHGEEDNEYMKELRKKVSVPIIKAVKVGQAADIATANQYDSDYLLLDAYSPKGAGGNGVTFDWTLIGTVNKPFFLAGGLSSENVREAVTLVQPFGVDASSSMETNGYKDPDKIGAFLQAVRGSND